MLKVGYIVLFGLMLISGLEIYYGPETQQQIFEEAKAKIDENENKDNTSFMVITTKDGTKMTVKTKQKIIDYAGDHGLTVNQIDNNESIVFEKKKNG